MTALQTAARLTRMFRRGWILILCLLASSLVVTASVCAGEVSGTAEISCGGLADTHDGTEDKSVPHQHAACHGHNVSAPFDMASLDPVIASRAIPGISRPVPLARRTVDPALEPPKA